VLIHDVAGGATTAFVLPCTTKRGDIPVRPHVGCSASCMIRRPSRIVLLRVRTVPAHLLSLRYTCHEPDPNVVLALPPLWGLP
jgi:hypothetical protein